MDQRYIHKFDELNKFTSPEILVTDYFSFVNHKLRLKKKNIISWHNTSDIHTETSKKIIQGLEKNPDAKIILINDGSIDIDHPNCYNIKTKYHHVTMLDINEWNMPVPTKEKNKWFLSLNKRANYFRQYLFAKIIENNLLDYGYLSYLCETDKGNNKKIVYGDKDQYIKFDIGLELVDKIPFYNFDQELSTTGTLIANYPWQQANDCLFQIICETYLTPQMFLTEKTLLPLAAGLFPLIIGCSDAMKNLEDLGFIFNKDIFDYTSWDNHCRGQIKMDGILTHLQHLIKNESLSELCEKWYPYSLHNYHYYRNGFIENWNAEKKIILDKLSDLLNLM